MTLMITNKQDEISIIEVMNVEYKQGESSFIIFDYNDNEGCIVCNDAYAAERCVKNLFQSGKSQIEGEVDWNIEGN